MKSPKLLINNCMKFDTLYEQALKGLAHNKSVQDIADHHKVNVSVIETELNKGAKAEKEHTSDPKTARTIAMDHLWEDPHYYTKLSKIEK